jgi:hypothetical protein
VADVRLILGDALAVLPTLDGIDAVITDPPFGIAYRNRRSDIRPREYADVLQGDRGAVGQEVIDGCFRRGWPVCAFAHCRNPWRGPWRQFLVWDKGPAVGGGGDRATCWKFTWELIQVGGFGRLNGKRDGSVLSCHVGQSAFGLHPTQKPLKLMRYLVRKLTRPGQTVFDPFMGSGSTAVACLQLGRGFVGTESDPAYFAVAQKRMADARGPLFAEAPGG